MNINLIKGISIILITFITFCCISWTNVKTNLYHDEVYDKTKAGEGKDLVMTCDELERHEKYSIVKLFKLEHRGGSVDWPIFKVTCCYEIAKIRGDLFFTILKQWSDDKGYWFYKIGFSRDDKVNLKTYYGDDIGAEQYPGQHQFISVKEMDKVFGKKK
jgi:hypothetical protein